jgi:2-polyprenyl-6-methoxyphenol hydroxylase-like FAD-dependent oxidoreductase
MGAGLFAILLGRGDFWQVGGGISKGSFQRFRAAGLESFHQTLITCVPFFADRVQYLQDWKQFSLLSVESSRLKTWYSPGLLFIGDAAHAMGPVGGVGINLAIQDAAAAANRLIMPLKGRQDSLQALAAVQHDREKQTRRMQSYTNFVQEKVAYALEHHEPFAMPLAGRLILKTPLLRTIPTRRIAFGGKATHVDPAFRTATVCTTSLSTVEK